MIHNKLLPLLFYLSIFLCSALSLSAQQTVRGHLENTQGEALIQATVLLKGTQLRTFTDAQGNFILKIPESATNHDTLVLSYSGLRKREIGVEQLQTQGSIQLEELHIQPIQIVGLSPTKDCWELRCGSIVGYSRGFQIPPGIPVVPEQLASGVVQIRCGAGRVRDNLRPPLYVLDGVPLSAGVGQSVNPLDFISPQEIESIQILNNESLFYCAPYQNVILITSKTGTVGSNRLSYEGLLGIGKLGLASNAAPVFAQQHSLSIGKSMGQWQIRGHGSFRSLPSYTDTYGKHLGGSVMISNKNLLGKKLHIGTQFNFNHITQDPFVPTANNLRRRKPAKASRLNMDNYFSRAYASYQFSDALKGRLEWSRFQHENPSLQRFVGDFIQPRLHMKKQLNAENDIRAELGLPRQSYAPMNESPWIRHSQTLELEHTYRKRLKTHVRYNQNQNKFAGMSRTLVMRHASAEIEFQSKHIDIDLDVGGICAYSRVQIEATGSAGILQSPLANFRSFHLGTRLAFERLGDITVKYSSLKSERSSAPMPLNSENLAFYPQVYDQLQNQGLNLIYSNRIHLGNQIQLNIYGSYCKENGLADEMIILRPELQWGRVHLLGSLESIRGWRLSGIERDFSRWSFLNLEVDLPQISTWGMKNFKLILSGQNLFTYGDSRVLQDQMELSRLRNASQFPFMLSKNLMLGVKMDMH